MLHVASWQHLVELVSETESVGRVALFKAVVIRQSSDTALQYCLLGHVQGSALCSRAVLSECVYSNWHTKIQETYHSILAHGRDCSSSWLSSPICSEAAVASETPAEEGEHQ